MWCFHFTICPDKSKCSSKVDEELKGRVDMTKEEFVRWVKRFLSDEFLERQRKYAVESGLDCNPDWFAKTVAADLIISYIEEGID